MDNKCILTTVYDENKLKPRVTKICPTNDLAQTWQCAIVDPRCIDLARRIAH